MTRKFDEAAIQEAVARVMDVPLSGVVGVRGVGKTEVALRVAGRVYADGGKVAYLDCSRMESSSRLATHGVMAEDHDRVTLLRPDTFGGLERAARQELVLGMSLVIVDDLYLLSGERPLSPTFWRRYLTAFFGATLPHLLQGQRLVITSSCADPVHLAWTGRHLLEDMRNAVAGSTSGMPPRRDFIHLTSGHLTSGSDND